MHISHAALALLMTDHPFAFWTVVLGVAFWLGAYVLAIIQGFAQKTYGIPIVAICGNVTWEFMAAFIRPVPVALWHAGAYLWLVVDLFIVYQVIRYGKARQVIPEVRRAFYPLVAVTMVLWFAGHNFLSDYLHDAFGYVASYMLNFVMSVLFIFMFFARRDASNLALAVAWTKMIGTGVISAALVIVWPIIYPRRHDLVFVWMLFVTVFLIDVLYVAILVSARRAAGDPAAGRIADLSAAAAR